jgi:mannose-1-phosphate guanylyltransferase
MLCALIMAGGKGERFWPFSTEEKPKQFLNLIGEDSMIQMTVRRLEKLIPMENIFVVTGKSYIDLVREQLPELPERNIIVEPVGKNTAPCIGLSAFIINKYYKDATIAVVPSDHLIVDEEEFRSIIQSAYGFIKKNNDAIVTIGMKPTRPDTGYGYIKYEDSYIKEDKYEVRKVEKFVEKPNLETAKKYLENGSFLWNGGMFIWKTDTILKLTKQYLNKTYKILSEIAATDNREFDLVLNEKYDMIDSISVDYGIMEKAEEIYVIPGSFGWDDVGTWSSVERIREKDSMNNVCVGKIKTIDSYNNIIISNSNKPIIIAGVENIFIIETEQNILVISKDKIEDIKNIKNAVSRKVD